MGIFSAINSLITSGKQNKMAKAINPVDATYQESKYTKNLYGEGKNLYQGRMAGATQAEQNLLTSGANTRAAVDKNATSGSQALAVAAGVQGQTDQGFQDLALKEAQDKQNRFGIYSNVSQLMTQEGDKVYQDKLRKYYDDLNYKRALEGSAMQNKAGFFSGIDDTINTAGQFAMMAAGVPPIPKAGGGGGAAAGGNQSMYNTPGYVPTRPQYPI